MHKKIDFGLPNDKDFEIEGVSRLFNVNSDYVRMVFNKFYIGLSLENLIKYSYKCNVY